VTAYGPFYALLGADILSGAVVAVLAATGVVSVTLRRGQAKPK
jgi:hypothetical protein